MATVITYPYIMAKTRLQSSKGADVGVTATLLHILQQDGFLAMYKV